MTSRWPGCWFCHGGDGRAASVHRSFNYERYSCFIRVIPHTIRMQAGRGLLTALTLCSVVFTSVDGMGVHSSGGSCPDCASPAGVTSYRRQSYGSADPCVPSPCGPNTRCDIDNRGVGVCRCLEGYFPKPDTITGCGPQCVSDGECGSGYVCRGTRCVAVRASSAGSSAYRPSFGGSSYRPGSSSAAVVDPCDLNLCGANANCDAVNGRAVCSCPDGYEGNPLSACTKGECIDDGQCPAGLACLGVRCVSPCAERPCGTGAECNVVNRRAICKCPRGYSGDPLSSCVYDPQQTSSGSQHTSSFTGTGSHNSGSTIQYQDVCRPSPCGKNTNCREKRGRAICSCIQNYIGDPLSGCRPECTSDAECSSRQSCVQNRCRNACTGACGSGARCDAVNHRAVCTCPKYYKGNALTGCYPECTSHAECGSTQACIQLQCGDPCAGVCGIGANCRVRDHTAICSCPTGYTGHPYDRCSPPQQAPSVAGGTAYNEVAAPCDPNASGGHSAGVFVSGTASSGNMCSPNPCGTLADCAPGYDRNNKPRPVCTCPKGYLGDPLTACQRGECTDHSNCPGNQACYNYQCTNPCVGESGGSVCGINALCRPQRHQGVCYCPPGFDGDPLSQCSRKPATAAPGGHSG